MEEGEFRAGVLVTSKEELEEKKAEEAGAEAEGPEEPDGAEAAQGAENNAGEEESAGPGKPETQEENVGPAESENISEPGMSTLEDPEAGKWPGAPTEAVIEPGPGA